MKRSSMLVCACIALFLTVSMKAVQPWTPIGDLPLSKSAARQIVQLANNSIISVLDDGKILLSTDDGKSWAVVHNRLCPGSAVHCYTDAKGSVYCGMADFSAQSSGNTPERFFRSDDDGRSWVEEHWEESKLLRPSIPMTQVLSDGSLVNPTIGGFETSKDKGRTRVLHQFDGGSRVFYNLLDARNSPYLWFFDVREAKMARSSENGEEIVYGSLPMAHDGDEYFNRRISQLVTKNASIVAALCSRPVSVYESQDTGHTWQELTYNLDQLGIANSNISLWYALDGQLHILCINGEYVLNQAEHLWQKVQTRPEDVRKFCAICLRSGTVLAVAAGAIVRREAASDLWQAISLPGRLQVQVLRRIGSELSVRSMYGAYAASTQSFHFEPIDSASPKNSAQLFVNDSTVYSFTMSSLQTSSDMGSTWSRQNRPFASAKLWFQSVSCDHQYCFVRGSLYNSDATKATQRENVSAFSSDGGMHWREYTYSGMASSHSEAIEWLQSSAIHGQEVFIVSLFGKVYRSPNGARSFSFMPLDSTDKETVLSSTCRVVSSTECNQPTSHSNAMFLSDGSLFFCRDSVLYISPYQSGIWQKALYQPPPNAWTLLSREVLHKDSKTAELLILSDSHNRVCVSVAGQPWKEIESDSASLFDTFHSFAVGSFSDNSIQLLAASKSDGLLSTTVTGLHLFDADKDAAELIVSPNPVAGLLSIRLPNQNDRILSARVLSLNGDEQNLLKPEIHDSQMHIDCSAYVAGVYVLEVQCSSGVLRSQFVVSR